jgi:hypothetical protein
MPKGATFNTSAAGRNANSRSGSNAFYGGSSSGMSDLTISGRKQKKKQPPLPKSHGNTTIKNLIVIDAG